MEAAELSDEEGSSSAKNESRTGAYQATLAPPKSNPELSKGKAPVTSHPIAKDDISSDSDDISSDLLYDRPIKKDKISLNRVLHLARQEAPEIMQKAKVLIRKKDLFHLVSSYPIADSTEFYEDDSIQDSCFSKMNQLVRELKALVSEVLSGKFLDEFDESADKGVLVKQFNWLIKEIADNIQAAKRILDKYDSDLAAYIPQAYFVRSHKGEWGKFGLTHNNSRAAACEAPDEMFTLAISSAIRQVSAYVKAESFKKIGISGSGGEEVARALMDIARMRKNCSVVLHISVCGQDHGDEVKQKIMEQFHVLQHFGHISSLSLEQLLPHNFFLLVECVDGQMDLHDLRLPDHGVIVLTTRSQEVYEIMDMDVEVRMEDHLLPWVIFCENVGEEPYEALWREKYSVDMTPELHEALQQDMEKFSEDMGPEFYKAVQRDKTRKKFHRTLGHDMEMLGEDMWPESSKVMQWYEIWEKYFNIWQRDGKMLGGDVSLEFFEAMCWDMKRKMSVPKESIKDTWKEKLFVDSPSGLQQIAIQLVKECHGNLLAIILLARDLKMKSWSDSGRRALEQLSSHSSAMQEGSSQVMKHVLKLIWNEKDQTTKYCIHYLTSSWKQGCDKDSLASEWISNYIIQNEEEGKSIFLDLISSFLLENVGLRVSMRKETKVVLSEYITSYLPSIVIKQGNLGLTKSPAFGDYTKVIELHNNKLSEIPEEPKCGALKKLWLQNNCNLMEIPLKFFENMPNLVCLDLSHTSIKSLPPSISRLKGLQEFYLRGCELLSELPPHIEDLFHLEVFDLKGTEIMYLPKEIGNLNKLRLFKVSLCGPSNCYGEAKKKAIAIPTEVLSLFSQLEELSIGVMPDGEWWDDEVSPDREWWDAQLKAILNILSGSEKLGSLSLYLPSVDVLHHIKFRYSLSFRFVVGRHQERIICRLPNVVKERFNRWEDEFRRSLTYINGEGMPSGVTEALKHARALFLDRHWTIKVLSELGRKNLANLECCLLVECNELQTIIDRDFECPSSGDTEPVLELLRHLSIHYMKKLERIWRGSIHRGSLRCLSSLTLQTCPSLTTIFTPDMVHNLNWLRELIVEDCPKIRSIVMTQEDASMQSGHFMRHLTKIALLDLPQLVSISGPLCLGEEVGSLFVCNCPMLESLYTTRRSPKYSKIVGEKEWWDSLKWRDSEWRRMTEPAFEELRTDEDFMDQLVRDVYLPLESYDQEGVESAALAGQDKNQLEVIGDGIDAVGLTTLEKRYESQKRRDWNTFGQYLKKHRPPVALSHCTFNHVLDFLRYLDQFGKTKVHSQGCGYFGQPEPPGPCTCPLRQAWGSLDALIGRLRAAYEENGGLPETNPFASGAIRVYLREVRDSQAKARGIPYKKKKKKKRNNPMKNENEVVGSFPMQPS